MRKIHGVIAAAFANTEIYLKLCDLLDHDHCVHVRDKPAPTSGMTCAFCCDSEVMGKLLKRKRKVVGRGRGRERKRKGKKEEGKGEKEIGSEALAETEKSQTPQPGIEPGTPANAADALPLSHRDKRHHQLVCSKFYPFCLHFTT